MSVFLKWTLTAGRPNLYDEGFGITPASMNNYRSASLWFDTLNEDIQPRPSLNGVKNADVVIIGAGYTGLWTAYYLKTLAPDLAVTILESETAGFGASGRNGGWLKGSIAGEDKYLANMPAEQKADGYRLLHGIVDHVHEIIKQEGIRCDLHKGGVIFAAARYPEQLESQRKHLKQLYQAGHTEQDYRWLDACELTQQVRMHKPYGAIFSPHCAVINPAQLVRGLAAVVERQGVAIYEKSPVLKIQPGSVLTANGEVRAKIIVPALEGYSGSVGDFGKYLLPVQSLIIATEPLSSAQWDEVGLQDRPAFSDGGRLITYGQRSADGRLIFGARGGYQFGAKPRSEFFLKDPEFRIRESLMTDLFPALHGVRITHGWGGSMGMSRRFAPHVLFDARSGIALAGGYGGGGIGASNLFGRTLADLILERDTQLTHMPWVINGTAPKRALRQWEPEPIPWLTYKAVLAAYTWEENLNRSCEAPSPRKAVAGFISNTLSLLLK